MGELRLTAKERRRILEGDHAALKRDEDPGDIEGQRIALRRRKAHRQPIFKDRFPNDPEPEFQEVVEIPEELTVWVELQEPKRHRKGYWTVPFTFHDERQASRSLMAGGPPGPPRDPGLRTRRRKRPRPKGEGVGSYTDETARGYGGGGKRALDDGAVDDSDLRRFRVEADERFARHRQEVAGDEEIRKQERAVRETVKGAVRQAKDPASAQMFLAGIQRLADEFVTEQKEAA